MAAPSPTSALVIRLFGPFQATVRGRPLPRLHSRKEDALLALLTLRHGAELPRRWLTAQLWPEPDQDELMALAGLRNTLSYLRRALGPEAARLLKPSSRSLALDLTGAEVDLLRFDQALARGDPASLSQALSLYRGPLLEGWDDEWVHQERGMHHENYLAALGRLADLAAGSEDWREAERCLRRAVAAEPSRGTAQRALMQALAARGDYAAMRQSYQEFCSWVRREQDARPDAETSALYQRLRAEAARPQGREGRAAVKLSSSLFVSRPEATPSCSLPPAISDDTITFLFTDIEGSSRLWEEHPAAMRDALARHDVLLREAIESHGGDVFKQMGDQFCAAFATAREALSASLAAQRVLQAEPWEATGPLRVRMALHTGAVEEREGDYFGPPINRVARMLYAGHGGQILLCLVTQELASGQLPEGASLRDLGEHRLKDLARPERIFQVVASDLPHDFPPLITLEAHRHNLPVQLTSFIGREREMVEVKRRLQVARLLILTGAGGCGKTRLALQVAAELLAAYPDGVWLVELAALTEPTLVPQAVAAALGLREEPARPLCETLLDALRSKQLLLVLDNCEHLVAACAALAYALLRSCPKLRLLVTSREVLGVTGEQIYRVPSLSLPPSPGLAMMEQLTRSDAVRLFVDRALGSQPGFRVTEGNAGAVAEVCCRLDGIPLAIELAAARVRLLTVEQIQARLEDRFRLLTGGCRTAPARQQTLRATMDWSYNLLTEAERALLRGLSVFAGGWTLAAAEAVCAGEDMDGYEVLDLLRELVHKSLVLVEQEGEEARYRLLETIRQYGGEKLQGAAEAERLRDRHRDWYLALAEDAEGELTGPMQRGWLGRLGQEHDNLRTALAWSMEREEGEAALRLGGALWRYWEVRGYLSEGRELLGRALTLPGARGGTVTRANALRGAGILAWHQGDYPAARVFQEESLAIFRSLDDQQGIATSLNNLGLVVAEQGDYSVARALCEESLAIKRVLGDERGIACSLGTLGLAAQEQGDYPAARVLQEESLDIFRALGDQRFIAVLLNNLGTLAYYQGDYLAAKVLHLEGLAIQRSLGDQWGIATSLNYLGNVAREQGDYPAAGALQEESLAMRCSLGDQRGIAYSLESWAAIAGQQGQPHRAARLFGVVSALRKAIGAPLSPSERAQYDRDVAAVRAALGEEAFAAAWAAGWALSLEEAVAFALDEGEPPSPAVREDAGGPTEANTL